MLAAAALKAAGLKAAAKRAGRPAFRTKATARSSTASIDYLEAVPSTSSTDVSHKGFSVEDKRTCLALSAALGRCGTNGNCTAAKAGHPSTASEKPLTAVLV
jgi:hypothetical protein